MAEGIDATFVAGLKDTAAPEDVWQVDAVYLDPRWVHDQDPRGRLRDRAGEPRHGRVGGGAGRRGPDARAGPETGLRRHGHRLRGGRRRRPDRLPDGHGGAGARLSVAGLRGVGRRPVGAPWIDGSTVTGVIGGLDGGGCEDESVSYSPPFDDAIKRLLARAEAGGPADDAPTVFDDDCD